MRLTLIGIKPINYFPIGPALEKSIGIEKKTIFLKIRRYYDNNTRIKDLIWFQTVYKDL